MNTLAQALQSVLKPETMLQLRDRCIGHLEPAVEALQSAHEALLAAARVRDGAAMIEAAADYQEAISCIGTAVAPWLLEENVLDLRFADDRSDLLQGERLRDAVSAPADSRGNPEPATPPPVTEAAPTPRRITRYETAYNAIHEGGMLRLSPRAEAYDIKAAAQRDVIDSFTNSNTRAKWLAYIAARARHVQKHVLDDDHSWTGFFGYLCARAKACDAFVHGLARAHKPRGHNWMDDALHAFEEFLTTSARSDLDKMIRDLSNSSELFDNDPHPAAVEVIADLAEDLLRPEEVGQPLRDAMVRIGLFVEADDNDDEYILLGFETWPGRAFTQGKSALLLGGKAGKESRLRRIKASLGFDRVDLLPAEDMERRDNIDGYDVYLLTRWLDHTKTATLKSAWERDGALVVPVFSGDNTRQIAHALLNHPAVQQAL